MLLRAILGGGSRNTLRLVGTASAETARVSGSSPTNVTVSVPAQAQTGDLLVALVMGDDTVTLPSGWSQQAGSGSGNSRLLTRTWDGLAASYTFTVNTDEAVAGIICAFRDAAFGVAGVVDDDGNPLALPGITVPLTNSLLCIAAHSGGGGAVFTGPSGFTRVAQRNATGVSCAIFVSDAYVANGSSGGRSVSFTGPTNATARLFSISPT